MFGQQQQLERGQLFARKSSYCICDEWGRGDDGADRVAIRKKASDAAIFQDLDPDMKSRVLQAGKNSANGKKPTPEDKVLEAQIESMLESGELTPQVAAALLRICHTAPEPENNFQILSPSLSTRSDGASDDPNYYYDNRRPSPGKRAGLTMDLLKSYMRSKGLGTPARGVRRWR